uniref:hypothetical protein n=1 Tax=Aeromonas sanarellii TaxID=633415 RepID=UPI003BA1387C
MTGLFKQLKDHGVDILTYRMIGIERIESFNSKRKLSFNPTIINLFQPVVQDIHIASIFREGANKQVISSQADSLIKISRIWAD